MAVQSFSQPDLTEPEYTGANNPAYAVNDSTGDAPYISNGWTAHLTNGIEGTPDGTRLGTIADVESRPSPTTPNKWWAVRYRDTNERESVTSMRGQMHLETLTKREAVIDPRRNPPPNARVTSTLSPSTYSFTRPMTGTTPYNLTGVHFSMANHERNPDEIFGMEAARNPRNTFRLDIAPRDTEIVDKPAPMDYTTNEVYSVPVTTSSGRAYRLG